MSHPPEETGTSQNLLERGTDEILMKPLTWLKRGVSRAPQGPTGDRESCNVLSENSQMMILSEKPGISDRREAGYN